MKLKLPTLICALFLLHSSPLLSQVEKVIYQYLKIEDSVTNIRLQLTDEFEIFFWHHENQILVESHARLDGGNMDLLAILIREGRYKIYLDNKFPHTGMKSVIEKRPLIKNKGILCQETVKMKIFIPDIFENRSPTDFQRIIEAPIVAKK
jgi:hypothetical protein